MVCTTHLQLELQLLISGLVPPPTHAFMARTGAFPYILQHITKQGDQAKALCTMKMVILLPCYIKYKQFQQICYL